MTPLLRHRTPSRRSLLACRKLPCRWSNLSSRQSASAGTPETGTHQASSPGPLGHDAGAQFHLRSDQPLRSSSMTCHLRHRFGAWRARFGKLLYEMEFAGISGSIVSQRASQTAPQLDHPEFHNLTTFEFFLSS